MALVSATAEADDRTQSVGSFRALAVGSALFAAAVVLPLLRQSGVHSWDTIWQEDGFEYFQQARRQGGLAVLFHGYQGYLQLPPRIFGALSAHVPIHHLALFMALASAVFGAAVALFIYYVSTPWIGSWPVRAALASLVVLMPILVAENTANVTNSIWIVAAALPWALVSRRERGVDVALCGAVAFLGATSTSLCFAFLPLAIGYAAWRRTPATIVVSASFTVGLIVQGLVDLHSKGPRQFIPGLSVDIPRSASSLADVFGYRVVGTYLFGDRGTYSAWLVDHGLLAVVSTVVFVAILVVLLPGVDRTTQTLSLVFVGYAVVFFVVPVWVRQVANPRYCVVPIFLLASSLAVLIAPATQTGRGFVRQIGRPVFVAQIVLVTCFGFSAANYRSLGPDWSSSVNAAQVTCASASPNKIVAIRVDAGNLAPIRLPCRDLSP
jgi:hypothetical protein